MGIKEYILRKKMAKQEVKYPIDQIYYAYTADGQLMAPFVFNLSGTKIKDIENDIVVEIGDSSNIINGYNFNKDAVRGALANLYNEDEQSVLYTGLCLLVEEELTGTNIPGKAFRGVRNAIFNSPADRETILNFGSFRTLSVGASDLTKLNAELAMTLAEKYKRATSRLEMLDEAYENLHF